MALTGCGDDNGGNSGGNNTGGDNIGGNNTGSSGYKTVVLGGNTWMAENLNVKIGESWCYEDSPDSCSKYGRLYTWASAKKACPTGWRLPSVAAWRSLVDAAGGSVAGGKLKSKKGWNNGGNGTDDFGFNALPGGNTSISADNKRSFGVVGNSGYWWTDTEDESCRVIWGDDKPCAYVLFMTAYDNVSEASGTAFRGEGYSVRCIKN